MCFELKSTSSRQEKDEEGTFAHSGDQEVPCAVIITGSGSAVQQTFPEAVDTPAPPSTAAQATGAARPLECGCCEGGTKNSSLHFILINLCLNTRLGLAATILDNVLESPQGASKRRFFSYKDGECDCSVTLCIRFE